MSAEKVVRHRHGQHTEHEHTEEGYRQHQRPIEDEVIVERDVSPEEQEALDGRLEGQVGITETGRVFSAEGTVSATSAAVDGRQLTLDSAMYRKPFSIQPVRPESTIGCGLRVTWAEGEKASEPGVTFSLSAGAGLGSPYLILHVTTRDNRTIDEYIDIRPLLQAWLDSALVAQPEDALDRPLPGEPDGDIVVQHAADLPECFVRDACEHIAPGVSRHMRLGIYGVVLDEVDPDRLGRQLMGSQYELGLLREAVRNFTHELAKSDGSYIITKDMIVSRLNEALATGDV